MGWRFGLHTLFLSFPSPGRIQKFTGILIVGIDLQRLLEVFSGLVQLSLLQERPAEVSEVIAEGIQPPQEVIHTEGHPCQRNPMPIEERRDHPPYLPLAKSPIVGIIDKIAPIVPVYKFVS